MGSKIAIFQFLTLFEKFTKKITNFEFFSKKKRRTKANLRLLIFLGGDFYGIFGNFFTKKWDVNLGIDDERDDPGIDGKQATSANRRALAGCLLARGNGFSVLRISTKGLDVC